MLQNQPYKWSSIKKGIGGFAWISLEVRPSDHNEIVEAYVPQDYLNMPYEDWKNSARNAIEYGLKQVTGQWQVTIKNIEGHILHTNAAMVAYASLRAFWEQVAFIPSNLELERLEGFVYSHWEKREPEDVDFSVLARSF
jgi:hypothetical protein